MMGTGAIGIMGAQMSIILQAQGAASFIYDIIDRVNNFQDSVKLKK